MIVPIAFAFDENLIMPAGVCITSLLENASSETYYDIFILHPFNIDLSKSLLSEIPQKYNNCRISYKPICNEFNSSYEVRGITTCTYYRLIIPEVIKEYDKILYSDVDVIFRDDLSMFYQIDVDDYYFAGVDNCSFIRKDVQIYLRDVLGLDYRDGYFYAGNLIVNSKKIREEAVIEKLKEASNNKYKQQDMDIINIVCNRKIKRVSPAFCLTNYIYRLILKQKKEMLSCFTNDELEYAIQKGIIHYNGAKPWNTWCQNYDIWWYYYRKSIFFSEDFCLNFYSERINDIHKWDLWTRVKHLFRYFYRL